MGRIIYSYSRIAGRCNGITHVTEKNGIPFGTDEEAAKQAMKEEAENEKNSANAKLKADGKTKEDAGYWLDEAVDGSSIGLCRQDSEDKKSYTPEISWILEFDE